MSEEQLTMDDFSAELEASFKKIEEGDMLEFGGLFGSAPVMPVSKKSSARFINRGGKIPAPMQSLKN